MAQGNLVEGLGKGKTRVGALKRLLLTGIPIVAWALTVRLDPGSPFATSFT